MAHLHHSVSESVRFFSFYLKNGTLGAGVKDPSDESRCILDGIDYFDEISDDTASTFEMIYAIYMNLLEVNEKGEVCDSKHAHLRVCQYIRSTYDENYIVEPPFEDWETELH